MSSQYFSPRSITWCIIALGIALTFFCSPAVATITSEDVWLSLDFDTPPVVAGQMVSLDTHESNFVPSRSAQTGNAYRFVRARRNQLTAEQVKEVNVVLMDAVLTDAPQPSWLLDVPFSVEGSHVTPKTAITFSAYVAPDATLKGAKIKVSVDVAQPNEADKERLDKKLENETNPRLAFVRDQPESQEIELTGEAQRIAAYCIVDNRLSKRNVSIQIQLVSAPNSEAPLTMKLSKLMLEQTHNYPHFTFSPSSWIDGQQRVGSNYLAIRDPKLIESFPVEAGTVAFWFRDSQNSNLLSKQYGFFGLKRGWSSDGIYVSNGSATAGERVVLNYQSALENVGNEASPWAHLVYSWDATSVNLYQNGKQIATAQRDVTQLPATMDKYVLSIGGTLPEGIMAAGEMDDFLILCRAVDASEVAQMYQKSLSAPLLETSLLVSGLDRSMYYRNETNAKLVFNVFSHSGDKNQKVSIVTSAGSCKLATQVVALKAGQNEIAIPFCPADLGTGTFEVQITGNHTENDTTIFKRTAEIQILPRLNREQFTLLSWGGMHSTPIPYLQMIGINTVNVPWTDQRFIDACTQAGMFVNIRVENSRIFSATNYNLEEVERQTRERLTHYRHFFNWKTTLVNSEVYGSGILKDLEGNAKWVGWASDELRKTYRESHHRDVELRFDQTHAPTEIPYYNTNPLPPEGIIDESDTLLTLRWFMEDGMPPYLCNHFTAKLVHSLVPDNIVWSEPCMSSGMFKPFDMAADWMYAFEIPVFYRELKQSWARADGANKPFMPTVTMGCTGLSAKKPNTDKNEKIAVQLTVDDLKIKTALALAAVPAQALSFFAVDSWSDNEPEFTTPNQEINGIIEPDSGKRFGKFMQKDLLPMAELLRNVPVVRQQTPIAIVLSESTGYYSGLWWGHYHYTTAIMRALGEAGVQYDVLYDTQMDAERLKSYKLVLFPAGKVVTRKNYDVLKEVDASPNTLLVVDRYCGQKYPNALKIDDLYYDFSNAQKATIEPIQKLLAEKWAYLTDDLPLLTYPTEAGARIQCETLGFMREFAGVHYAVVINNARTTGKFNEYLPEKENYRPYGKAQKITTRICLDTLGKNTQPAIYSFPKMQPVSYRVENGYAIITEDFEPAQTQVYCIYPKALASVTATVNAPQKCIELRQKYTDGTTIGGRQVVHVQILDEAGNLRDESGLYTMENGAGCIPLFGSTDVTVSIE